MDKKIVIACAMKEEITPFLEDATSVNTITFPTAPSTLEAYEANLWGQEVILMRTGIGLTNAAMAATLACLNLEPKLYLLAGTIGGLAADVKVGQIILGTSAQYFDADATAFGYQIGQIPQMPVQYESGNWQEALPSQAGASWAEKVATGGIGLVLSGNSFVTGEITGRVRESFVGARGADMETCAAAQVCMSFDVPWLCIRAVSDLCQPGAGEQFHIEASHASGLSCQAVKQILT